MSLFNELKRRNVIRVATAYVVASWLIIQVVETILPIYGHGDAAIRLIVSLLAVAFIPTLVFSWVFEITPEGIKREVDVVREHSITRFTGKKLDRIIMMLLALALGYFAFDKFILDPVEDAELVEETAQQVRSDVLVESYGEKSIAVLPFVNMSADPEQEYFSDGISEELLNLLSKIPDLRVISRSSAFSFKDKDFDISTIAKQLNVAHIIEGSVRKAGNQVRITAQLIEARSDTHLWSETYDRELENVFAIQDEISAAIVNALKERLGLEIEAAPRVTNSANIEAHDAYLRGRYLLVQRTKTSIEDAAREFKKAIASDPDFALAEAELAIATILLSKLNYGDLTHAEALTAAALHAQRAMALDAHLAQAHAATGLFFKSQSEYEKSLAHYGKAIQINPNYSIVHNWMANSLEALGQYDESFAKRETALRLNPLSKPAIYNYVMTLIIRDRLDEAERELEKIASIHPSTYADAMGELAGIDGKWASFTLGSLYSFQITTGGGSRDDLHSEFAVVGLERESLAMYETPKPRILRILGKPGDAVTAAKAILAATPTIKDRSDLGLSLAAAGNYDRARPILEEMWQQGDGQLTSLGLINVYHAAALIAIRRLAGEDAGVGELMAAIRDNVRRYNQAGIVRTAAFLSADFEEGLADYLAGERDKGLALIAKAAEDGYFILPNEAYLQSLYDDPGFAPIMAGQQARQARERNRFLAIVCIDNPYAAVWQPAEGTCESYAAEGGN